MKLLAPLAGVTLAFAAMLAVYEATCYNKKSQQWIDAALRTPDPTPPHE